MWLRRRGRKVALKDPAIVPWLHQSTLRFTRTCEMEETRYELDFLSDHTTEWDYTNSIYPCNEKSLSAVTVVCLDCKLGATAVTWALENSSKSNRNRWRKGTSDLVKFLFITQVHIGLFLRDNYFPHMSAPIFHQPTH